MAAADSAMNPKTTLVELCQRYTGKSMSKTDIVYKVSEYENSFQATVRLECMDGQEFAGELCSNTKEAEQSAAAQALEGVKQDIGLGKGVKRKADAADDINGILKADAPNVYTKARLREAVKQVLARDLVDEDLVYEVNPGSGGHICTLKIPSLPGALGARTYFGPPSPFKRDTMLNAAQKALDAILADPECKSKVDMVKVEQNAGRQESTTKKPNKKKKKNTSASSTAAANAGASAKGMGKGMFWDPQMFEMMMMWFMKGKGKGKGGYPSWDSWGDSWGWEPPAKKAKKQGGPDLARERVTEMPMTGEVVDWKGKFGWIKPNEQVSHKSASKNQGRIYVHIKDIAEGGKAVEKGSTLQFQAYVDSSGLGAEEVVVL